MAQHHRVDDEVQADPVVQLDLGRRGTDDVGDRHRLAHTTTGVDAREDEQGLRVATHTGREVVEAEQVRQRRRVLLGPLEVVEERELPVQEHLVTAGHVDEHLGDGATEGCLLAGDVDGGAVDVVERGGQLADLVRGLDRDRVEVHAGALTRDRHLLHERGEAVTDHTGGLGEAAQRGDQAAGDDESHDDREAKGRDRDATGEVGAVRGDIGALLGESRGVLADGVADDAALVDPLRGLGGERLDLRRLDGREVTACDVAADGAVDAVHTGNLVLTRDAVEEVLRAVPLAVTEVDQVGATERQGPRGGLRLVVRVRVEDPERQAHDRPLVGVRQHELVDRVVRLETGTEVAVLRGVRDRVHHLEGAVDVGAVGVGRGLLGEAPGGDLLLHLGDGRAVLDGLRHGVLDALVQHRDVDVQQLVVALVESADRLRLGRGGRPDRLAVVVGDRLAVLAQLRGPLQKGPTGRVTGVAVVDHGDDVEVALLRERGACLVLVLERSDKISRLLGAHRVGHRKADDVRRCDDQDDGRRDQCRKNFPAHSQPAEHAYLSPSLIRKGVWRAWCPPNTLGAAYKLPAPGFRWRPS